MEIRDSILSVLWGIKGDDASALGTTIRANVDICADNVALDGCNKSALQELLQHPSSTYLLDGTDLSDPASPLCKEAIKGHVNTSKCNELKS